MNAVYNPESEMLARLEKCELDIRMIRRKVEHARGEADKRVLNQQLNELRLEVEAIKSRVLR